MTSANPAVVAALGVLVNEGVLDAGLIQALARGAVESTEPKGELTLKQTAKYRTKAGEKFYPRHPKDPMTRGQAGAIYGICGGKATNAPFLRSDSGLTVLQASGVINALKKGHAVVLNEDITLKPA